jgi:hypothetical protein
MVSLRPRRGILRKSDLRETNERLILSIVRENRDVSRSDIVRITGLSASSVTFIVNRLITERLLTVERKSTQPHAGRPPVGLRLRPESMYAIGAEIAVTGTRIRAADVNGRVLLDRRVASHANPAVALARLRTALSGVVGRFADRRLVGIGVGIPGTVARDTGYVVAAEDLGWFEVEVGGTLAAGLPVKPLIENDAKLAAFAEHWFHPEGTASNFVFVAGARGLGTGVFVDGEKAQSSDTPSFILTGVRASAVDADAGRSMLRHAPWSAHTPHEWGRRSKPTKSCNLPELGTLMQPQRCTRQHITWVWGL